MTNGRNGDGNRSISQELNRGLKILVWLTVILYLALAGLGIVGYLDGAQRRADIEKLADSTHAALCVFVDDLERRVEGTEQFLEENPAGISGLSAIAIRESISSQRLTLEALKGLNC